MISAQHRELIPGVSIRCTQLKFEKPIALKCIQRKLDIGGNWIIALASSLNHNCEKNCVNWSYSACHKKR